MSELRPYLALLIVVALLGFLRRAAGRLAPRAALAPLLFLVTRWPVLLAWGIGTAGMFALLVRGGQPQGRDPLADLPLLLGLSAFCGLGFAALVVGPGFMLARVFAPKPVLALEPDERVLRACLANHFLNGEARGGRLLVTNRRLGFQPHRFNVQLDTWSVPLEDIRSLGVEGERLLLVQTAGAGEPAWIVAPNPPELAEELSHLARLSQAERARAAEPS